MKKIRLAGLLLLAPLTILSACSGGVPLSFTANWYRNTALGGNVNDTFEELTYEVTFTPAETTAGTLTAEYDTGTYKTKLENKNLTLEDGSTKEGYTYTTELSLSGRFRLGSEVSETFHDTVTSTVSFLPAPDGLRPVGSEKEVISTSPVLSEPTSLENAYTTYHYTYSVVYDAALTTATATYTDLTADGEGTPQTREYDIEGDTTFLDNEQILFALRGIDLSTTSASFRTINSVMGIVSEVATSTNAAGHTSVQESVDFTMDGTAVKEELEAVEVPLIYQSTPSGQAQTLVYAATTDPADNTYRNVLLRMEVPVLQSLGTLVYTLKEAAFATK